VATEADLGEVRTAVEREHQALRGQDNIALRVGRVINRHKMAKHFDLTITDDSFSFSRKEEQIAAEAALDGIYVVRASAPHTEGLSAADLVVAYKDLKFNEAGFRSLKAIDLDLRPIYHYSEDRVRAHVFICMLALYLVWHLRKAWAPLCFTDEAPPARTDPVAPARRSAAALAYYRRFLDWADAQPVAPRDRQIFYLFLGNAFADARTIATTLRSVDRHGLADRHEIASLGAATRVFEIDGALSCGDARSMTTVGRAGKARLDLVGPTYHYPPALVRHLGSEKAVREFLAYVGATFLSSEHERQRDWP